MAAWQCCVPACVADARCRRRLLRSPVGTPSASATGTSTSKTSRWDICICREHGVAGEGLAILACLARAGVFLTPAAAAPPVRSPADPGGAHRGQRGGGEAGGGRGGAGGAQGGAEGALQGDGGRSVAPSSRRGPAPRRREGGRPGKRGGREGTDFFTVSSRPCPLRGGGAEEEAPPAEGTAGAAAAAAAASHRRRRRRRRRCSSCWGPVRGAPRRAPKPRPQEPGSSRISPTPPFVCRGERRRTRPRRQTVQPPPLLPPAPTLEQHQKEKGCSAAAPAGHSRHLSSGNEDVP